MSFDITTSTAVKKTGFDLANSRPVNEPVNKPDFIGASFIEPAQAIASSLGRSVVGGVAGTLQALNPMAEEGEGARTVKEFTEGAFKPETEAGKAGLESLSALVQQGVDIVNYPISGLAALTELIAGQGIDQAVSTINEVQKNGISTTAGQRIFEETGSPLAATIAEVAPDAILCVAGFSPATRGAQAATTAARNIAEPSANVARAAFQYQTPATRRIGQLINEGSTDVETASLEIDPTSVNIPPTNRLLRALDSGGAKVRSDKKAVNAINQGFDEGVIAAVKNASVKDNSNFIKMVDIMERGKANRLFAQNNRPSDVAGDSLISTFNDVLSANRASGSQLQIVANSLRGQPVDFQPTVSSFLEDLSGIGVTLGDDFKPQFMGSDVEGIAASERLINQVVKRMRDIQDPDAFKLHKLKRFIDEQVSYGKSAEGLTGRTEGIIKGLRKNIDQSLDNNFPEYDRVNTTYSETIGAIDALQSVAGKKMNLSGGNADKATGTLLRRIMGNPQSRINLIDSIDLIESAAKKYAPSGNARVGPTIESNLLMQTLFVDELDRVFGPVARTSFQGQIDQALKQGVNAATSQAGAVDLGLTALGKAAEKAKGINQKNAFKSIKELLNRGDE